MKNQNTPIQNKMKEACHSLLKSKIIFLSRLISINYCHFFLISSNKMMHSKMIKSNNRQLKTLMKRKYFISNLKLINSKKVYLKNLIWVKK